MACFTCPPEGLSYLCDRDKKLANLIQQVGPLSRPLQEDLFSALIHAIVGQQISTKAQATVWQRLADKLGQITPSAIAAQSREGLQSIGLSFRKVDYIKAAAHAVLSGTLDISALPALSDQEVIDALVKLPGIGVWTAEMLLLFSLGRIDVLSYGDLGIKKGIMRLYHHKDLPLSRFQRYQKRYSPYGSVASLYLWHIAGQEDFNL
ncbi:DNA-3-methyladenine glycosylase [Eubacteriales bacterium OttesenSCG-928-M02]|nr:DNA-3-methyladenine glycosylase [Eubacteriales bacterium OttesenSCG-928-M02]